MALRQSNLGQLFIRYELGKPVLITGTPVYDMMQLHAVLYTCPKHSLQNPGRPGSVAIGPLCGRTHCQWSTSDPSVTLNRLCLHFSNCKRALPPELEIKSRSNHMVQQLQKMWNVAKMTSWYHNNNAKNNKYMDISPLTANNRLLPLVSHQIGRVPNFSNCQRTVVRSSRTNRAQYIWFIKAKKPEMLMKLPRDIIKSIQFTIHGLRPAHCHWSMVQQIEQNLKCC